MTPAFGFLSLGSNFLTLRNLTRVMLFVGLILWTDDNTVQCTPSALQFLPPLLSVRSSSHIDIE